MLSRSYLLIFYIENHENKKSPPVKQSGKHFYKFLDTLNCDLLYFLLSVRGSEMLEVAPHHIVIKLKFFSNPKMNFCASL